MLASIQNLTEKKAAEELIAKFSLKITLYDATWQDKSFVIEDGHIAGLNLAGQSLSSIPREVFELPNLEVLILDRNTITDFSPLQDARALRQLSAADNHLQTSSGTGELVQLTHLNLMGNSLERIADLDALTHLERLNLSNNRIQRIDHLNAQGGLTGLYLSYNQIAKLENLDHLQKLWHLYIASNRITKIENLGNLKSLKELDLGSNQIAKIENLEKLASLQDLNLSNNQITTIENLEFFRIPYHIYLEGNPLGPEDQAIIKRGAKYIVMTCQKKKNPGSYQD